MPEKIIDEILQIKDVLPRKQQKLCNYLVMNYEQVGLMTVAELAQAADVGTTTVMRLVQTLGRPSYGALKKELHNCALIRTTTSYQGLKKNISSPDQNGEDSMLSSVAADGIQVLENLCTPTNMRQFDAVLQMMLKAKHIYSLGLRSSRPLATYFVYMTTSFYPHASHLCHDTDYVFDQILLKVTPADMILIFSVWPCTRRTIEAAEYCHKLNIPIALITNTSINPIVKYADAVIDTNSVNHSSGDTVMLTVVEAIVSELGHRLVPESTKNLEKVEAMLEERDMVLHGY